MSFPVPLAHVSAPFARLLTPAIVSARPSAPPVHATLAVGSAHLLSTVPSLLPRSAPVQGILTGLLVLVALVAVTVVRAAARRRLPGETFRPGPAVRLAALAATATSVLVACLLAHRSLVARSAELGMPSPAPAYWLTATLWTVAVVGLGLGVARLAVRAAHAVRRSAPQRLAVVLLAGAAATTAASATGAGLLDGLRKDLDPDHVMLLESPLGATRAFARGVEAATPEEVADLAVERLVAAGGLARRAVVVALPTGSGWVNDHAVTAIEHDLSGDVAFVSAQAGDLPSWFYFLFDQEPARRSARALLDGVLREVDRLAPDERPDVYVMGESLGAVVGQSAVAALPRPEEHVCGVLWSGAPGAVVSGHPHERSLLNDDDPVVYLSARTAYQRPEDWPGTWMPLLSYGTTWLDTDASLRPPDGHGHQYGAEQDWTLPAC